MAAATTPADPPRSQPVRTSPPPPSDATQIAMVLFIAAPVVGAMCSAPIVGGTLATLATLDSLLILFGINY